MQLPIDQIRDDFDAALSSSSRLVVTAETGAGKSTRIPMWLAETADDPVLVVEPRRVACTSLADFLASERGEPVGKYVGSRVRFSDRTTATTRVLFVTPGVALRMLADPDLALGALVVDEFHERSWQMDLVVASAASLPRLRETPLILTSATMDAENAAGVIDAQTLHATGRTFPVHIEYDGSTVEPSERDLADRAAKAIDQAARRFDGDILVFLPGMRDIRDTESALGRRDEEVVIVHGSQPPEALQRAFRSSNRRRIYLSTNVAETSITLPGVRVVVDSGLAKSRMHRAGRAALATGPVSQASMDQRAGRAGRVAEGACIRLWSERYRPAPFRKPEIERTELDELILHAAKLGLVGPDFEDARWITPPPEFAVAAAKERLGQLGALKGEALSERGQRLAELPVAADEAALLANAPAEIDATLCDIVAILQSRGSLLRSLRDLRGQQLINVKDARAQLLRGVTDEVMMSVRLLRDGDVREHHLSGRRMKEARAISRQLRTLLGASGTSLDGIAEHIARTLPEAAFVLRPRAQKSKRRSRSQPWANGSVEVNVYPFEPLDPETDPKKPTAAVILETAWLGSGTSVYGIGRMLLPTKPGVLADAGVGEVELADAELEKSRGRVRIVGHRHTVLAGVTLDSGTRPLTGRPLCNAVASFVAQGRLFRGVWSDIRDRLHAWMLLAEWPEPNDLGGYVAHEAPDPENPEQWLADRLRTLGVERASDLQLLENEDLAPDLEELTGIPDWVAQPIIDDFPRTWSYQGATYLCRATPASGKVVLEPADKNAKKRGEPPTNVLPRFRDFQVVFRQASRVVRLR